MSHTTDLVIAIIASYEAAEKLNR